MSKADPNANCQEPETKSKAATLFVIGYWTWQWGLK